MASLTTITPASASDRTGNVIGPHVIAEKRKERAERKRLMAKTLAAEGLAGEAAAP